MRPAWSWQAQLSIFGEFATFLFRGPASSIPHALDTPVFWYDEIGSFRYLSYRFHTMLRLTASNRRRPYFLCQWYKNVKSSVETNLDQDAFSPSMLYPGENREGYFWQVNHSFIPAGLRNVLFCIFLKGLVTSFRTYHFEQSYTSFKLCK